MKGGLVFAGDGWFVKAKNIDAYQGLDPKGKVVILTQGGLPAGLSQQEAMQVLMGGKRGEDWMDPAAYAQKKGAIGLIILQSLLAQANPDQMERTRKTVEEGTFSVAKLPVQMGQSALPTLVAHLPLAQALFSGEKVNSQKVLMSFPGGTPVSPFELSADKKISFTVKTTAETVTTQNVVAIVEGSDPVLKDEYVALGAHYDHTGTSPNAKGDTVFNGADDDGTGTAALLAIAQAVRQAPKPPRAVGDLRLAHGRGARVVGFEVLHDVPDRADRKDRHAAEHRHDRPQQAGRRHQRRATRTCPGRTRCTSSARR